MNFIHLRMSNQVADIIVFCLMALIVILVCACLWLAKQIMLTEARNRIINQEIEKRSNQ